MDASIVVASLSAVVALAAAVMTYRASGKATDVNEQANQLQWVKELRADAGDARREVTDLRTKVADLSRELSVVTREAEQLIAEMQLWRRTAWRDGMSIDRFREFVGPPSAGINGRHL
ncbi:hypothetical protein PSN13_06486 [Micromonospora saelicesensis]|uniref:Uncharacterized protein n=1 Tax=Micromonospora saelicesensis TaxID=285676 RepID=A0A328NCQ1_9ACTN|nr:hypothetical protein [Micromonospora saelicesensis]RAO26458.1 hypothetical protein PSN13_06486 [Micromonospora saelicesensis]